MTSANIESRIIGEANTADRKFSIIFRFGKFSVRLKRRYYDFFSNNNIHEKLLDSD